MNELTETWSRLLEEKKWIILIFLFQENALSDITKSSVCYVAQMLQNLSLYNSYEVHGKNKFINIID